MIESTGARLCFPTSNADLKLEGSFMLFVLPFIVSFSLSGDYTFTKGIQGRVGHEFDFKGAVEYFDKNVIELGFRRDGRAYRDLPLSYDSIFHLKHVFTGFDHFYIEKEFEFSKSPDFSPELKLALEPHVVWSKFDLSLGGGAKKYPRIWTLSLRPQIIFSIRDGLLFLARSDVELKPDRLASGEGVVQWTFLPGWTLRLGGGGGKTDEGSGLDDDFYQTSMGLWWQILPAIRLRTSSQIYRGDLRKEFKLGGGVDCFF